MKAHFDRLNLEDTKGEGIFFFMKSQAGQVLCEIVERHALGLAGFSSSIP